MLLLWKWPYRIIKQKADVAQSFCTALKQDTEWLEL